MTDKEIQQILKKYSLRKKFAAFTGKSTCNVYKRFKGVILQQLFKNFMAEHIKELKEVLKIK